MGIQAGRCQVRPGAACRSDLGEDRRLGDCVGLSGDLDPFYGLVLHGRFLNGPVIGKTTDFEISRGHSKKLE